MSTPDRLLAAKALTKEPIDPKSFPLREWGEVYLRESDPEVSTRLEWVIERATEAPVVEWLIREATSSTGLRPLAARRLLADPREGVRMMGVKSLARQEGVEAEAALRQVLSDARNPVDFRTVAAHEIARSGRVALLVRWCEEAAGQECDARLIESVQQIVLRTETVPGVAAAPR